MIESRLTTVDNPHDPFTDPEAWRAFDIRSGYNTLTFLARILVTSAELSDADQALAYERAVDEIVAENVNGMWRKVTREVPDIEGMSEEVA